MAIIPFIPSVIFYVLVTLSVLDMMSPLITKLFFFYYLEEEIKWVDKDSELLDALWRDVYVVKSGGKVSVAFNLQLNQVEEEWLKSTRDLARKARCCHEKYKNLRGGRYVFILNKIKPIYDLVWEVNRINIAIKSHLAGKKNDSIHIFKSLERQRSKIGSLKERNVYLDGRTMVRESEGITHLSRKANELSKERKDLISGMESEIQTVKLVILLQAFVKDLHMLQLESETEKVWVKQAEHMILEAENAIDIIFKVRPDQVRWLSRFGNWIARQKFKMEMKWLSRFGNWIARQKFKMEMKYVQSELTKLLERKDRFDFKFIYTDASKLFMLQQPFTLEDTRSVDNILSSLSRISACLIDEIKPLRDQLNHVFELLNDAEGERLFHSMKFGLEQVKYIAQVAVGSIESYMNEERPKYLKRIEPIKRTVFLLDRILTVCHIEQKQSSSVVSFEEEVNAVVSKLTSTGRETRVISIMGMWGVGKTTLAKEVYHHRTILHHFRTRAWVNLPTARKLFQNGEGKIWIDKLRKHLERGRRPYLLVLHDMQRPDWDILKEALPNVSSGSRILYITRYFSESSPGSRNYYVRLRTKEQSWKLYKHMLTLRGGHIDPREEKLIKKVVGRCGGLPWSILTLAYEKPVADELHKALERFHQGWGLQAWLENLDYNFTFFKAGNPKRLLKEEISFLLPYLSYLRLFPRDFEIPRRRLLALWLGEGLVHIDEANSGQTKYKVAGNHFYWLINLNLIQIVEGKFGGKTKTCSLPGVLGELILRYKDLDPEEGINLNRPISNRLVDNYDNNDDSFEHIHGVDTNSPDVWLNYGGLLSFISTDTREGNKPREDIHNFLDRGITNKIDCFGELKVLDLERVFRPKLPQAIGKLIALRYLGLRWTYIEEIPSSIGNLNNLETLDLKHTHIRNLPITIWEIKSLEHLYLDQIYRSVFLYASDIKTGSLNRLQTLWGAFLDESSPLLKNEHDWIWQYLLTNLTKLDLTLQLEPRKQKEIAKWVANLKNLQRLSLRSINHGGKPQALHLEPLSGLPNLYRLHLSGNIDNASISIYFPRNLTDITLSATNLQNDPMQDLQSFPKLRSLCLYSDSFTGESIVCSGRGFPQLNFLKLWKLKTLKKWNILKGAMPYLWELEIRSCHLLEVPSGLEHLSNLHELKLRDMPEKFTTTIEKCKLPVTITSASSIPHAK
ncbi:Disease resistance protein [Quillaja saponaria]|uniref:Disease resistance protein n=1 Tax=Quillaja saponaria TaxID=32244 RepID=A0AAD7LRZ8_QUISA|nr:Disease resistance protein [Quillaja saponaria]